MKKDPEVFIEHILESIELIENYTANKTGFENQIDQLVYKLYDLTPEEIEIVEGFNEGK